MDKKTNCLSSNHRYSVDKDKEQSKEKSLKYLRTTTFDHLLYL